MEVLMELFRHSSDRPYVVHPHPHAHQIGMAAVLVALLGMPLAYTVVLPLTAVVLAIAALLLSRHPAQGMDASPEGWVGLVTGLLGLFFGTLQLLLSMRAA